MLQGTPHPRSERLQAISEAQQRFDSVERFLTASATWAEPISPDEAFGLAALMVAGSRWLERAA